MSWRAQRSCFYRSLTLQLAWVPNVAYPSFNGLKKLTSHADKSVILIDGEDQNSITLMLMWEKFISTVVSILEDREDSLMRKTEKMQGKWAFRCCCWYCILYVYTQHANSPLLNIYVQDDQDFERSFRILDEIQVFSTKTRKKTF